ncbi:MAG: IPT/TIG domain-containing protein, partial [Patescibacteria group bacterium]
MPSIKIFLNKNNKNSLKKVMAFFIFFVFITGIIFSAVYIPHTLAQGNSDVAGINNLETTGLKKVDDLKVVIMKIVRIVLGFLGIVAIILIIYGGFLWMTSEGSEDKIKIARKILINTVIGLIIILSAFTIVHFVLKSILEEGKITNESIILTPPPYEGGVFGSSFVIKWMSPGDEEKDVPLCRMIQVGFSNKLKVDTVDKNNVLISIKDGKKDGEICSLNKDCASGKCEANKCFGETVSGTFRVAEDVFQFKAAKDFEENAVYQVEITTNVKSKNNVAISSLDSKRKWIFATGNMTDTTPPQVRNVYPTNNATNVCLAAPVETVFSEPMDAISLMNKDALSINPTIVAGFSHNVESANILIANPNETYEKNKKYIPLLNSNIIADSCGNFLDGNGNGTAEKSPTDDFAPLPVDTDPNWSFTTGTQEYCKPEISSITSSGYYDGSEVIITGNYFTLTGKVIFNNQVYSDLNCFNTEFYPNAPCVLSWSNSQIKLKVPAGGFSNGATNGGVYVEIGENISNIKDFIVASPHINWISPEMGGKGQYVTLSGVNFGSIKGIIYLVKKNNHTEKMEALFPCDDSWTDNQIIIKIPETITLGEYYLQIKTSNDHYSNINDFIVNNNPIGPGVCSAVPNCGVVGTEVVLSGEKFGTSTNGKVYFGDKQATTITSWSETQIKVKAPTGIRQGGSAIKIKIGTIESNGISFTSPCDSKACDSDITTASCEVGACSENETCNASSCICESLDTKDETACRDSQGNSGILCSYVCISGITECSEEGEKCSTQASCQNPACATGLRCNNSCICQSILGSSCQRNLDCNPKLVSVPGQTWDGGFEENISGWNMTGQKNSYVRLETVEAFGGGKAIHIHQDPNQNYLGKCNKATCENLLNNGCTWISSTKQCKFYNGDSVKGWNGPVYYSENETLNWGNTNRVMWLKLTYNTVPLKLEIGKTYTYSFYYKGHSSGKLNMNLSYDLGWVRQCAEENYYNGYFCNKTTNNPGFGQCLEEPGLCCINNPYQKKCYTAIGLGSVSEGNYSEWTKFNKDFVYTQEMAETLNSSGMLQNEIGMTMGYNSTGSLGTDLYIDNVQLEEGNLSSDLTCCNNTCRRINQCRIYLPQIDSISPENGKVINPITTYVTIRGKNFGITQGTNKILFGNSEASLACQSWSDTEIIVIAPFGIRGTVPIKITTNQGNSNTKNFIVNDTMHSSICSLSPNHGKIDDKVIISGINFGDSQMNDGYKSQIFFNSIEAEVNSWSNEKIEIVVPNGITIANPKVKVILKWEQMPQGMSSNEVTFYMNPFITEITPDKGPIDSYVTIRGGNFGNMVGEITFNGIKANLASCANVWSNTEIVVLAPSATVGPVVAKVTLPNGEKIESNNDKKFTYNNEPIAPGICLETKKGSVGDSVIIKGNKFGETQNNGEGVTFNQVNAEVFLKDPDDWTNYQIDTKVPQTSSGDVVVTKIVQHNTGKKECTGGVYVAGLCVGGTEKSIMENVILKSNPVWFEIKKSVCGNNTKEGTEICDGGDLDKKECSDLESAGTGLKCKTDCSGFDISQCKVADHCINKTKDLDEVGIDCGGKDCSNCIIPSIETYNPTNKEKGVCINREPFVVFNQIIDKESLNATNIFLKKGDVLVSGTISYIDENNKTTVVFSP